MTFASPRRGLPGLARDVRREIGAHLLLAEEAARREKLVLELDEDIRLTHAVRGDAVKPVEMGSSRSPHRKFHAENVLRSALRSLLRVLSSRSSLDALGEKNISLLIAACQPARGLDEDIDHYLNGLTSRVLETREKSRGTSASTPSMVESWTSLSRPEKESKKDSDKERLGMGVSDEQWVPPKPLRGPPSEPLRKVSIPIPSERVAANVASPSSDGRGRLKKGGVRSLKSPSRHHRAQTVPPPSSRPESHGDGGEAQFHAWAAHPVLYRELRVEEVRKAWAKEERQNAHRQELLKRRQRVEDCTKVVSPQTTAVTSKEDSTSPVLPMTLDRDSIREKPERGMVMVTMETGTTSVTSRGGFVANSFPEVPLSPAVPMEDVASLRSVGPPVSPTLLQRGQLLGPRLQVSRRTKPTPRRGPFRTAVPRQVSVVRKSLNLVYSHYSSRLFVDHFSKSFKRSGRMESFKNRSCLGRKGDESPSREPTDTPFEKSVDAPRNLEEDTDTGHEATRSLVDHHSETPLNGMISSSPKTSQEPASREYLQSDAVAAPLSLREPFPTGTLKDSNGLPSGLDGLTRQRDSNPSKEVENMFMSFGASMTAFATSLMASVSSPGATSHELDRGGRTVTSTSGDNQMPLEDTGSSIRDDPGLTDEPAVLPPASVSQAFESLGHVDSHQATRSADETSTFDHIIAKSMRRRSKRIVRKAINRVKARSEGKTRGDSPHGSSQTLRLNSISETSEEDAVGFAEASIDNTAAQAVKKVNVRQENTIVEPRVDVASRKREELNAAPLDSSLSREYRGGTRRALESLNEVTPFNGKPPRVSGSKMRASANKIRSRTHIDSTLTMSASKLYKTFIASRDVEGDSPLSNRGVSKVYIQSMLRGISQSRASGARHQRILSRSRFHGKALG